MKKFTALFLIFSLVMLSVNLYAKERRGAKLTITKKDGQQIEGELITVKPKSLLLLNTDGKDVSVGIADIKVIRVVKKSKAGLGAGIGAGIGFVIGAGFVTIWNLFTVEYERISWSFLPLFGVICSLPSLLIGALFGAGAGRDKTMQIEGMSDSEIQEALDYLRKKARIRDYR